MKKPNFNRLFIIAAMGLAMVPVAGMASKPCLDLAIGTPGKRIGEGIINENAKGQTIRLKSRNCRAISVGVWVKNVCKKSIWVKLAATRSDRWFDIDYKFKGSNETGTITRGNLNLTLEPHSVVDGRIRISCARGKLRAKRKLKEIFIRGYIVNDPDAPRDAVRVKAKFL